MTEAERLREQAERCIRLAKGSTDSALARNLMGLAAEYQERALEIERMAGFPQPPSASTPPQEQPAQQQQPQPKKEDE